MENYKLHIRYHIFSVCKEKLSDFGKTQGKTQEKREKTQGKNQKTQFFGNPHQTKIQKSAQKKSLI